MNTSSFRIRSIPFSFMKNEKSVPSLMVPEVSTKLLPQFHTLSWSICPTFFGAQQRVNTPFSSISTHTLILFCLWKTSSAERRSFPTFLCSPSALSLFASMVLIKSANAESAPTSSLESSIMVPRSSSRSLVLRYPLRRENKPSAVSLTLSIRFLYCSGENPSERRVFTTFRYLSKWWSVSSVPNISSALSLNLWASSIMTISLCRITLPPVMSLTLIDARNILWLTT